MKSQVVVVPAVIPPRRENLLALLLLGLLVLGGQPVSSVAPEACRPEHVPALGLACRLENGLYEVVLEDGTRLRSHGLDQRTPEVTVPDASVGFDRDHEQRPPVCADEFVIHVLYGHPAGKSDRTSQVEKDLRDVIWRMNAVINQDGLDSGGIHTDYNVLCDDAGEIVVDTFEGPSTGGAYTSDFSGVVNAARAAGFNKPGVNYLVFYDDRSPTACGVANLSYDERLSPDNQNLKGPNYGVNFEGCWFGRTPMHENAHNMGAVQRMAPMSDLAGHCLEGDDVMCYPYPTQFILRCPSRIHFDCNHDTYFHTDAPEGSWLASHWNLGHPYNVYLTFGRVLEEASPEEDGQEAPAQDGEGRPEGPQEQAGNGTGGQESQEQDAGAQDADGPDAGGQDRQEPEDGQDVVADAWAPVPPTPAQVPLPFLVAVAAVAAGLLTRRR